MIGLLLGLWRCPAEQSARCMWSLVHDDLGEAALAENPDSVPALMHACQVGAGIGRQCAAEALRILCRNHRHLVEQVAPP